MQMLKLKSEIYQYFADNEMLILRIMRNFTENIC